jgi:hypothetical protein
VIKTSYLAACEIIQRIFVFAAKRPCGIASSMAAAGVCAALGGPNEQVD